MEVHDDENDFVEVAGWSARAAGTDCKTGRAQQVGRGAPALEQVLNGRLKAQQPLSALELAGDIVGSCQGPGDLSTESEIHGRIWRVRQSVVLDTGPLISLIDQHDQQHAWVQSQFSNIEPPLLTCEPVLTEACFLARREFGSAQAVLSLVDRGVVRLAFSLAENWTEVRILLRRYTTVPMSLADACLVRMSELVGGRRGAHVGQRLSRLSPARPQEHSAADSGGVSCVAASF